jgi:hypothetical protein
VEKAGRENVRIGPPASSPGQKSTEKTPPAKAFFFLLNSVIVSLFGRNAGITRTFL